jgi:AcrR family transcriptional regulator
MKSTARKYVMRARAASASDTRQRILDAAVEELWRKRVSEVRLEDVASRAEVTVQTVLRVFESRARLIDEAGRGIARRILAQRESAAPGDVEGSVRAVFEHYEDMGDYMIRLLADEERLPDMTEWLARGRKFHRRSMRRQFGPQLARRSLAKRPALLDALVVACDVYTWKLVRRDMGRSRREAETLVCRLVESILKGP